MSHAETFLAEVDSFLSRSGMSPSAFGREAINDPNFVSDLKKGRMPSLGLVDRIHDFMRERIPAGRDAA